jgi:hypothetical protein
MLKEKTCANVQRIIELFTQKLSLTSQKYGFGIRDPGKTFSGSRIQGSKRHRIPDPGVKKAPDPGSGYATLPASRSGSSVLGMRVRIHEHGNLPKLTNKHDFLSF